MPSTFPDWSPSGDTEETRKGFLAWLEGQEADFPLEDPTDRSWRPKAIELIETYVHQDVVVHGVPVTGPGRAGWMDFLLALGDSYPDSHTTYDVIVVEGDMASAYWTYRATQRTPLMGKGDVDVPVEVSGVMFERIRDGQVVEHWALLDQLNWLKQIGLIDPAAGM